MNVMIYNKNLGKKHKPYLYLDVYNYARKKDRLYVKAKIPFAEDMARVSNFDLLINNLIGGSYVFDGSEETDVDVTIYRIDEIGSELFEFACLVND